MVDAGARRSSAHLIADAVDDPSHLGHVNRAAPDALADLDPVVARQCIKCPRKRVRPSPAKHQAQAQDKHILKGIFEKRFDLYQGFAHGVAGIGLIAFAVGSRQSAGKHSSA